MDIWRERRSLAHTLTGLCAESARDQFGRRRTQSRAQPGRRRARVAQRDLQASSWLLAGKRVSASQVHGRRASLPGGDNHHRQQEEEQEEQEEEGPAVMMMSESGPDLSL